EAIQLPRDLPVIAGPAGALDIGADGREPVEPEAAPRTLHVVRYPAYQIEIAAPEGGRHRIDVAAAMVEIARHQIAQLGIYLDEDRAAFAGHGSLPPVTPRARR